MTEEQFQWVRLAAIVIVMMEFAILLSLAEAKKMFRR